MSAASTDRLAALGIGGVVAFGQPIGHTFAFEPMQPEVPSTHPDQAWLSRCHNDALKVGVVVYSGAVHMEFRSHSGDGFHVSVTRSLDVKDCAHLARLLLCAAIHLEGGAA